jgi:hypothetical protein
MAEPIGPLPEPFPSQLMPKVVPNVSALSKQMQDQVLTLADHLQKVLDDPAVATQRSFLNEFVSNVANLSRTVDQAISVR